MRLALVLSGVLLSACVATWTVQGDQTTRVTSHLVLYGLAFAAYAIALRSSRGLSPRALGFALAAAVAWRVALVAAPPLLSDDVYRYVWEGRIQLHGGNPYVWTDRPEVAKWAGRRDAVWQRVTHKDYTAVYPPLAQLAAAGVVALRDSVTAMKAFAAGCELMMLWVLARSLRRRQAPPERLLVLAWSPLALVEIAGSGHNDALGMLFLALALLGLDAGRPALSVLAAALGFEVKLLPGLIAAAWARRYRLRHAIVALVTVVAVTLPYAGARAGLWRSLGKYGEFWRFNETLFAAVAAVAGSHTAGVRLVAVALMALALGLAWRRTEPAQAGLVMVIAALVLAPNVLPWYALWLLPFLVLRDCPAALLFTGTVGLAYLVYPVWLAGAPWRIGWGLRAVEYGPCLAVALWSWARAAGGGARPRDAA